MGADDNIRSYFSNHLQPPLVLPRRGDEGYSVTVFSILVTPLLYFLCRSLCYCIFYTGYSVIVFPLRLLRYCIFYAGHFAIVFPQQSSTAIAICPSPTGEVRWGLMTIFGVTSLIIFSPLSFSPVGEMKVTLLLYFLYWSLLYCIFYAGHSVTVFSIQVTPLLSFL